MSFSQAGLAACRRGQPGTAGALTAVLCVPRRCPADQTSGCTVPGLSGASDTTVPAKGCVLSYDSDSVRALDRQLLAGHAGRGMQLRGAREVGHAGSAGGSRPWRSQPRRAMRAAGAAVQGGHVCCPCQPHSPAW